MFLTSDPITLFIVSTIDLIVTQIMLVYLNK